MLRQSQQSNDDEQDTDQGQGGEKLAKPEARLTGRGKKHDSRGIDRESLCIEMDSQLLIHPQCSGRSPTSEHESTETEERDDSAAPPLIVQQLDVDEDPPKADHGDKYTC